MSASVYLTCEACYRGWCKYCRGSFHCFCRCNINGNGKTPPGGPDGVPYDGACAAQSSLKRAWQHTQHPTFPKSVDVLAMGPVWREADVQKFIETPRVPGRKRKEETR